MATNALGAAQTPSTIQQETKKEWDTGVLALMEQAKKNQNANVSATPAQTPVQVQDSYAQKQEKLLSDQYAAQERKRIAALKAQKEKTLSVLEGAKTGVEQQYQTGKATTAGTSALQARNLAEFLAQRGQTQSGLAAAGAMASNASLMSALGGLEQTRATALSDIDLQKAAAESAYRQGLTEAQSDTELQKLQALQNLAQQTRAEDIANVGQYYDDYQARINYLESIGDPQGLIPSLRIARQQKLSGIAQTQQEQAQQEFENWLATQKLNLSIAKANKSSSGGGGGTKALTPSQALSQYKAGLWNANIASVLGIPYTENYNPSNKTVKSSESGISADTYNMIERWRRANTSSNFMATIKRKIADGTITQQEYNDYVNDNVQ